MFICAPILVLALITVWVMENENRKFSLENQALKKENEDLKERLKYISKSNFGHWVSNHKVE